MRLAKRSYYEAKLKSVTANIRGTWNILNQIINGTKRPNKLPSTFVDSNNQDISNPCLIANQFYNFFANLGPSLARKIPTSVKSYRSFLPERFFSSFFFESASQCEVVEIANSLRIKVPMWSVKDSINYISEPLTYIINLYINSGVVPDQMKLARVVPPFKSGDETLFSNYRPVSVLPMFSKFLEKIAYIRLINYLDKHKLLANNQYGFRKNQSTSLALLYIQDKIISAVDEKKYTAGLLLHLSKAIDTVNQSILLGKLEHYGIRALPLNGSTAIFATDYSMLNSMVFHPLIRKFCLVYLRGQSLVPYSF